MGRPACSFCKGKTFESAFIDENKVFIVDFCQEHYNMLANNVILVCPRCLNVEMEDKADHILKHPERFTNNSATHLWMMGYKIRFAIVTECEWCRNIGLGWNLGGK